MDIHKRESFDRSLKNVIDSFERAREWADLSNCLQKVKRLIENNAGLQIPRQRDLAKRLAQCLNPDINVIHQLTLEVYTEVFEREVQLMNKDEQNGIGPYDRKSNIALFFSGLFNFYQFAAFEVKQKFLNLISDYLLKMKKELILSLPGFILCMLPALEDQNSDILKKVESILGETEKIVGTSEFYGEIWKAMLRTPRARLSAIKYMDKRIPATLKAVRDHRDRNLIYISDFTIKIINQTVFLEKDQEKRLKEESMLSKMELHDYFYFYYPNKSKLIMNAMTAGLSVSEEQVQVNRGTLDFMISHMPINSNINSIEERIRLVECVTLAYTRKDFATLNKISNWLFGHIDEEDEEVDDKDPTIITIVQSQKNMFKKSMDIQQHALLTSQNKQTDQTQNLHGQISAYDKLIVYPILVLLRILSEEQNVTLPILKHLSIHLLKFIKFHLVNRNADIKKFKGNIINLLEQISPYFKAVLQSLAEKLEKEIDKFSNNSGQVDYLNFESIDLISFVISDLQQLYNRLLTSNDSQVYLVQILSNLLKGMVKLSNQYQNFQLILPSLDVIEQIIGILYKLDDGATLNKQKSNQNFREAIESFNNLYVIVSQRLIQDSQNNFIQEDMQAYKLELDTFSKYTQIMFKIIQCQNVDGNSVQMPNWLEILIQSSKTPFTNICIVSAQVFSNILKLSEIQQNGDRTIQHIQRLIADSKKTPFGKISDSHCKEIIQNLWEILDQDIDTALIVELLREFDLLVPKILSDVVTEDLQNKQNRVQQERAIKKFSTFWRITSGAYPNYMPFSKEINGKKYLALHNMLDFLMDPDPTLRLSCRSWLSQNKQYNRILDPLIEEFIKNSNFKEKFSNGALQQSSHVIIDGDFETEHVIQNFSKLRNIILNTQDEIVQYMMYKNCQTHIQYMYFYQFMKQTKQEKNPKQQVEVLENQFWAMGENFYKEQEKRLTTKISDFMPKNDQVGQIKQMQIPGKSDRQQVPIENLPQILYLDILVEITLYFIRAEYSNEYINQYVRQQTENQNNKLSEILTINASACEFMELILKQLGKQASISNKIAHFIVKPLIDTFYHVIERKNYAMQVNIINLLDSIFNECNFQGAIIDRNSPSTQQQDSRNKCKSIFLNSQLIDGLILGLKSDVSYVRQKFIKFVEMYVPYLRKFTKENEQFKETFKIHIEKLIDCFCLLLKKVDVSFFSSSTAKQIQSLQVVRAQTNSIKFTADFDQMRASEKRASKVKINETKIISDEDEVYDSLENFYINQESDIILLIGGLQCIIYTCLDIKTDGSNYFDDDANEEELNEEDQIRLGNSQKTDSKKNVGFLQKVFGGGETSYFAPDIFGDLKQSIYKKLENIFVSFIYCWNNLELLNWNDYHFTRSGMFSYYSEDTRKIIEKLRKKKQSPSVSLSPNDKQDELNRNECYLTFDELLQIHMNPIQKRVTQFLRPIAKKIPEQFVEGVLTIWIKKSTLGSLHINRSYLKLIQMMIVSYQVFENEKNNKVDFILPVHQVIYSIIKYINSFASKSQPLVNTQRWSKNSPVLNTIQTTSETLLCHFLYAYLVYQPCMFDTFFESRSDEKIKEYQKVYQSLLKYFSVFKLSRNPYTINWLIEILNVTTLKYSVLETKMDNRLKKDFHELLNDILSNMACVVTDSFNIEFNELQKYCFVFPPTVYELLWRYEYIVFKHSVTDSINIQLKTPNRLYDTMSGRPITQDHVKNAQDNQDQISENIFKSRQEPLPSITSEMQRNNQHADIIHKNFQNLKASTAIVASSGSIFFNKAELKQMVDQRFEYQHSGMASSNEQSIFKNMEILLKDREHLSKDYIRQSDFMETVKFAIRGETDPRDMLFQSKYFTTITLKQILCQVLINLLGSADNEKITKTMQIICHSIISVLQQDFSPKKNQNLDIKIVQQNKLMNEFIVDFFSCLIYKQHQMDPNLIKIYRKDIVDFFNMDNFFQVSMINLKEWQKIMKCLIDSKPDEFFEEQMQKWNFTGGIFERQQTIILQKCFAMKRIAFLIFSCEDDEFSGQLDQLMKKMIEVFKQQSRTDKADIKQRLFLFFLTRVMLVRLNFTALTEALRKLWPHLLNELISVFEIQQNPSLGQSDQVSSGLQLDKENTDLTIEAIKLVELLSSLNIEDFQMNQWIFLIDGYGMKSEKMSLSDISDSNQQQDIDAYQSINSSKLQQAKLKQQKVSQSSIIEKQEDGTEVFKTFIIRFIGNGEYSFYNVGTPLDGEDKSRLENYFTELEDEESDLRDKAYSLTFGENFDFRQDSERVSRNSIGSEAQANSVINQTQSYNSKNSQKILQIKVGGQGGDGQIVPPQPAIMIKKASNLLSQSEHGRSKSQRSSEPISSPVVKKEADSDNRLQDQACSLQKSINDQNLIGNEFNRHEAEFKIETDFLKNDEILKA